jgi:hypothetical protein
MTTLQRNLTIWVGEIKFRGKYFAPCGAQVCHGKEHALEMIKTLARDHDLKGPFRVAKYVRIK